MQDLNKFEKCMIIVGLRFGLILECLVYLRMIYNQTVRNMMIRLDLTSKPIICLTAKPLLFNVGIVGITSLP